MLEAGIGRPHNIALTTLGQFILPGDTASSSHYWEKDIIHPEVIVKNGVIDVPNTPGLGYEINWDAVDQYTVDLKEYKNESTNQLICTLAMVFYYFLEIQ